MVDDVPLFHVIVAERADLPASQLPRPVADPDTLPDLIDPTEPWQLLRVAEKDTVPECGLAVNPGLIVAEPEI
jgi:hypothetical protein